MVSGGLKEWKNAYRTQRFCDGQNKQRRRDDESVREGEGEKNNKCESKRCAAACKGERRDTYTKRGREEEEKVERGFDTLTRS